MPIGRTSRTNAITPRMAEVIRLLADGLDPAAIGVRLGITEATVDTHLADAKVRLRANNRVHLVSLAYMTGLLAVDKPEPEPEPEPTYFLTVVQRIEPHLHDHVIVRAWGEHAALRSMLAIARPSIQLHSWHDVLLQGTDAGSAPVLAGTMTGAELFIRLAAAAWFIPEGVTR